MEQFFSEKESQAASNFLAALRRLLTHASENDAPVDTDDLEFLINRVKSARTGFPLIQEERPAQQIDRLGCVLLGPVFTSDAHPWPLDSEGGPMAPLCQINVAELPVKMDGMDGLIQIWLASTGGGQGDSLIRVIPAAEVDAASITPVIVHNGDINVVVPDAAAWIKDMHVELKPSRKQFLYEHAIKLGYASQDELADADWGTFCHLSDEYYEKYGDDVVPCWQITGFGKPRVYCDITEDQKAALTNLEKLRKKLEKKIGSADDALRGLLAEVGQSHKAWVKVCGGQEYPCLFGTFQEIQYRSSERSTPFLCFESIGDTEWWGDGGNAQVFYSKERGFTFDWSCY